MLQDKETIYYMYTQYAKAGKELIVISNNGEGILAEKLNGGIKRSVLN